MPDVLLHARCPVEIIVDTENRTVTRVVVLDEMLTYDDFDKDANPDSADALRIAENEDDCAATPVWPGWEFGW